MNELAAKSKKKGGDTPVMRQYLTAKEAYPDALLFFRLGDFYELFFEDAVTAARALDLTLTARNKGAEEEVPMAGVPHHAASGYIQKLIEQGYSVALCEQMADPSTVKGIVPREVVRVVTPGIVFDDSGLAARENHFLVAVERDDAAYGIAALDLSTGELLACEAEDDEGALGELIRLDPRELLVSTKATRLASLYRNVRPHAVMRVDQPELSSDRAAELLDGLLGPGESARSSPSSLAMRAAARCVGVAKACEAGRPLPIAKLTSYELAETLVLDEATQSHLELVRSLSAAPGSASPGQKADKTSLLAQIDATKTPAGARLLRKRLLAPLASVPVIRRRQDAVELFFTNVGLRRDFRELLAEISDIERLSVKFAMDRAAPRDITALRASLRALPRLVSLLDSCESVGARGALSLAPEDPWVDLCAPLRTLLEEAIADEPPVYVSDGGVVRNGFDVELDESRALAKDGQKLMVALEARLREESQIPSLKLRYTRVFGWYMEVTKTHVSKASSSWRRKQTVATGERFTCDELDDLADKLAHAEERGSRRELELFGSICKQVAKEVSRLRAVATKIAEWDVASALAEVAHRDDYVRPVVDDSTDLEIVDGRHPVVEKLAAAGRFVSNDVSLAADGEAGRLWLVTGPNMAGKSTLIRQVALIVILAQMGAYVPAKRARVGIVDRVLTRVGASDNLARGESTFMVEMKETANVLRRAGKRSLVVLDEIGRGTSTYDGLAIAWAVAEHLYDVVGCRSMFATHYHELTDLATTRPKCENWSVSARPHEGEIVFLHKLVSGAASRSYGVECARLAGLPEPVLARARAILSLLEKGGDANAAPASGFKAKSKATPQLDLFAPAAVPDPVLETLRATDVDRLTPLDALTLIAKLKRMLS